MSKHKKVKTKKQRYIKMSFQLFTLFFLIMILLMIGVFYKKYGKTFIEMRNEARKIINQSDESVFYSSQSSLVYDINGKLISTIKSEKEVYYLHLDEIPDDIIQAMVVTEDRKFLDHNGVDFLANIRAALTLVKNKGKIKQGASTITQQLARNIFLTHEVSYDRKVKEIFIAQEIERKYSKYKIMEFYLNNIYYANGYYGIQAASKGYFNKDVNKLSISEKMFLCAIPNNPTVYNPRTNFDNTILRRDRILKQMVDEGKITDIEYKEAIDQEIILKNKKSKKNNSVETYAYYCAIRSLMKDEGFIFRNSFKTDKEKAEYDESYTQLYHEIQRDLYVKGYRIYTSIDMKKQKLLQEALDDALKDFDEVNSEGIYTLQGASVSIDNETGKVVAIVGGREQEFEGIGLNRAYQSFRQPGSAIKPLIVYAPAFERGYVPNTIVNDNKFKDGPNNSGGTYRGEIPLSEAIARSSNTVAWRIYEEITPKVGLSYLLNMKFSKIHKDDYYPSTSLGGFTVGTSALEMASGFATLANDGFFREPTCIIKITDADDNLIVKESSTNIALYQTSAARIMTETLIDVIHSSIGTGRGLALKNTISAGKTGTTSNKKDGWFVGYTPYYTTSVWVGYDIPKSLDSLRGGSYPAYIWKAFMDEIHEIGMNDKFKTYEWIPDIIEVEEEEIDEMEEDVEEELDEELEDGSEEDIQLPEDNENDIDKEPDEEDNSGESELPEEPDNPEDEIEDDLDYDEVEWNEDNVANEENSIE